MKTCTKCGETKALDCFYKHAKSRGGIDNCCKQCRIFQTSAWAKANPDKVRTRASAWARANPEKANAWARANPEKVKAKSAAWARANPEKANAWARANPEKVKAKYDAWARANPEKVKAKSAAWARANPEKVKATAGRARVKLAPAYVARLLDLRVAELTPEHLALKRMQLTVTRNLKTIDKLLTEKQDKT